MNFMATIRTLDWRSNHDERSRAFGVRSITTDSPGVPIYWNPGPVLDQKAEGACVGFGWSAEASASPKRVRNVDNAYARQVYEDARAFDRAMGYVWPEGASVLAGAKVMKKRGLIDSYYWAFGIDELRNALCLGPVVIGINWPETAYEPRPSGMLDTSGRIVGGHCILVTGYHPKRRFAREGWFRRFECYRLRNSWGEEWGRGGDAWIKAEDLASLLADNGESCVPVGRKAA